MFYSISYSSISSLYSKSSALINIISNELLHYSFTAIVNNCGGSFHVINDPYDEIYAPTKVNNVNVKHLNLMSRSKLIPVHVITSVHLKVLIK